MTGIRTTEWFNDYPTVFTVGEFASDQGELRSASEAFHFIEKPWNYPELHLLWRQSLGNDDFPWSLSFDNEYRECPVCEIPVRHDRYARHWNSEHVGIAIPRESATITRLHPAGGYRHRRSS